MLNNKNIFRAIGVAVVAALFGTAVYAQSSVSKGDREFMEDIAHANLAEVAMGHMALEKSQNAQVKQFAQKMIDDHSKAEDELKQLADSKGVKLPTEPGVMQKTKVTTLKSLFGETFDKQYVKHAGVGDHENAQKLLTRVQSKATDADLKSYADKTIKAVEEHLAMAKQLEQLIAKK